MCTQEYQLPRNFQLESGEFLEKPTIAFHTFGKLKPDHSNVIWVCHALTGSSDVFDWWSGLFGSDDFFNPEEHFIVCANVLGSHYGSTGPLSTNPNNEEVYFHDFPEITIRDITRLHIALANHLGFYKIEVLIGGSMGGHQALEWSILEADRIDNLIVLASSAVMSPWSVAFNESQRMAIANDPTWEERDSAAGLEGMKVARSIALLSYRNYTAYEKTQKQTDTKEIYPSRAASYQQYQGEKLSKRFNAFSYWHLSKAMDSHNVGRGRGGVEKALAKIRANTLIISIEADNLFPLRDQLRMAKAISGAKHQIFSSDYGHDGFLIETKKIASAAKHFLTKTLVN